MNDFWNNISRYPRFFISSFTGLLLIILSPFKILLKRSKSRLFLLIILLLFLLSLYNILRNMLAI
uniref:hypothetical protein n=1 Tax=Tenuicylindrus belgicus TaxID=1398096 RepID=UPI002239137A|nr:hypothetical protein ON818_pgp018 [Tenuicylindrus belgicus]UYC31635.1 hypothetical protein [Tenuicylindrus belgicus]